MRQFTENNLLILHKKIGEDLISPSEFVAEYLLKKSSTNPPLTFQRKTEFENWTCTSEIMQFINEHHWKGYSDRIRRSLIQWYRGAYPLILWTSIPTPQELLEIQSRGQRVVTIFLEESDQTRLHHGKTPWEFTVHDLIHADHFFEKPDWREGQIQFYRFLLRNWNKNPFIEIQNRKDFEYLISDMNSHPRHMFWTLQAIVVSALKEKWGLKPQDRLPSSLEEDFQSQVQVWKEELSRNAKEIF